MPEPAPPRRTGKPPQTVSLTRIAGAIHLRLVAERIAVGIDLNAIINPPGMACVRLSDAEVDVFRRGVCPDCGAGDLREGPHGGCSVNYACGRCKQVFCDLGPFGVDRIVHAPPSGSDTH